MASFRRFELLLLLAVANGAVGDARAQQARRFDGESGLYVWERRDSVHVQWITAEPVPGTLTVLGKAGGVVFNTVTPEANAHHAVFRKPAAETFTIHFGAAGQQLAALEQTAISLKPAPAPVTLPHTDSLYVIADTHGELDAVTMLLRNAGLINDELRWTGGRRQLVFLGDVVDRGADVTRLLWLLYRLEREAKTAGGGVHLLLGNHEIMVMLGDLRYVHEKEKQIATLHNTPYPWLLHPRQSVLGRWLASKPALIKAGDVVLVHGGASSEYAKASPQTLGRTLARHIQDDIFLAHVDTTRRVQVDSAHYAAWDAFFWGDRSLFWHRDYVQSDTMAVELDRALASLGATAMVVGHTAATTIHLRYGGKLIVAHPSTPAKEMLLITGKAARRQVYRLLPQGPPQLVR